MTSLTIKSLRVRLARHYLAKLRAANDVYLKGHDSSAEGLALFDREWSHIKAWQAWAASYADRDPDAADLCYEFCESGRDILSLRLPLSRQFEWYQAALHVIDAHHDARREMWSTYWMANAHLQQGNFAQAEDYSGRSLAIARERNDRDCIGLNTYLHGEVTRRMGDLAGARAAFEEGVAIFSALNRSLEIAQGYHFLGQVACNEGDWAASAQYHGRQLAIAIELGSESEIGDALLYLSWSKIADGNYTAAHELLDRCIASCQVIGNQQILAAAHNALGSMYVALGQPEEARRSYETALEIAGANDYQIGLVVYRISLGEALTQQGCWDEAIEHLAEAIHFGQTLGMVRTAAEGIVALARAYRGSGALDLAAARVHEAAEISAALDNQRLKTITLVEAVGVLAAQGDLATAAGWAGVLLAQDDLSHGELEYVHTLCAQLAIPVDPQAAPTTSVDAALSDILSGAVVLAGAPAAALQPGG